MTSKKTELKPSPKKPHEMSETEARMELRKLELNKESERKPFKFSEEYRKAHALKTRQLALLDAATHIPGVVNNQQYLDVIVAFSKDTSNAVLDFEELQRNQDA